MKKILKYMLYIMIVLVCIIIDQYTKGVVKESLALGKSNVIIKNFFSLTYIHNKGAAFGMMNGQTLYLIIFSVLVIFFIIYQFYTYKNSTLMCSFFSILLGGLLGNFIDRIKLGYVVDFLDFKIIKYDFPIFNFADICICLSIALIIYGILKYEGGMVYGVKDTSDELGSGQKVRSDFDKIYFRKSKSSNKTHKRG